MSAKAYLAICLQPPTNSPCFDLLYVRMEAKTNRFQRVKPNTDWGFLVLTLGEASALCDVTTYPEQQTLFEVCRE